VVVKIDIPNSVIADMFCSAIESGDPVTTASRGGWCAGINLKEVGTTELPKGSP